MEDLCSKEFKDPRNIATCRTIIKKVNEVIDRDFCKGQTLQKTIVKYLASGAVDVNEYATEHNRLVRVLLTAALIDGSNQYIWPEVATTKEKRLLANLRHF